jgi:hypothetical protein
MKLAQDGLMAGSCGNIDEYLVSLKRREFLYQMNDYRLFEKALPHAIS